VIDSNSAGDRKLKLTCCLILVEAAAAAEAAGGCLRSELKYLALEWDTVAARRRCGGSTWPGVVGASAAAVDDVRSALSDVPDGEEAMRAVRSPLVLLVRCSSRST
jgi:hypothetical protein